MKKVAFQVAAQAMGACSVEKDQAQHIKKAFDTQFGPTWHCVVGRAFGSYVTHETKHFIYFYIGAAAVLLWKSG